MKTSPYLGGQVKIDLVADHIGGDSSIVLDEVHVVPISDRIWYSGSENQLINRHSDNIRELYFTIQDKFFSSVGDQSLDGYYPYFSVDGSIADTVDHTYQMGLRRMKRSKYQKDASFLLPMWIDSEDYIDRLEFFVHVDGAGNVEDKPELTSKKFEISPRLRKYLKDYLSGVTSDLMYIGLRESSAYITGLEVDSGTVLTKDISSVIQNLVDREKPILEIDNLLARQLSENKTIARQLMNFNLCFSVSDLFSSIVDPSMHWSKLNIWCEARLKTDSGYEDIPLKDIYSNYTDIYPYKVSNDPLKSGNFVVRKTEDGEEEKYNVLDYLGDYKNIDLIGVNRMLQPNFHWSFTDNQRYTWNLYNGFSPLVEENGRTNLIEGRFFDTPDIMSESYSVYSNNIRWMTVLDGTAQFVPGVFVRMSMNPGSTTRFAPNSFGCCWSKGIKYNIGSTLTDGVEYQPEDETVEPAKMTSSGIYANLAVVQDTATDHLSKNKIYCAVMRRGEWSGDQKIDRDYVSIIYILDGSDITRYSAIDSMTLLGVRKLLSGNIELASALEEKDVFDPQLTGDDQDIKFSKLFVLGEIDELTQQPVDNLTEDGNSIKSRALLGLFSKCLSTVEYPNVVRFDKTLYSGPAASPSIKHMIDDGTVDVEYTTETQYYKQDDNFSTYLFRYDGNIIPQFIDPELGEIETDEGQNGVEWSTAASGAFNNVWRKKQFALMSSTEIEKMNRIAKQRYTPLYPSIGFYYLESEPVSIDRPYVPDGYLGEVCWYRSNEIYYVDPSFTIVKDIVVVEESEDTETSRLDESGAEIVYGDVEEKDIKRWFTEYVSQKGVFSTMENPEELIEKAIWPMYGYESNWEYANDTEINHYTYTVKFSLK